MPLVTSQHVQQEIMQLDYLYEEHLADILPFCLYISIYYLSFYLLRNLSSSKSLNNYVNKPVRFYFSFYLSRNGFDENVYV